MGFRDDGRSMLGRQIERVVGVPEVDPVQREICQTGVVMSRRRAPAHAGRVDMSLWQHAVIAVAGDNVGKPCLFRKAGFC